MREPHSRGALARDMTAIVVANLASFGVGELVTWLELWLDFQGVTG